MGTTNSQSITFCVLILRAKFRNRAILFDETLIKLFDTDIGFERIFYSLNCFVIKKNYIFQLILESVYVPGDTI